MHWKFLLFQYNKKIKISPIIITGYVSVSQEVILNGAIVNALFYLGGGVLANTMLLVLGLITQNFCSISREIVFINAIQIITSIIPFEGSDGRNILRVVRYKMKYDSC